MANKNKNLNDANRARKDEFYTQLTDIEKELKHYKKQFRDKIIFCNCDDPYESNFFKYFANNFAAFGLKKLIATCYDGSPIAGGELSLFDDEVENIRTAFKVEMTEALDLNHDGAFDLADVKLILNRPGAVQKLKGNGDFRSPECIELLKQADIVATNPPFSLFREYVAQLIEYDKKFIIIGNQNAITYKEIFPLFMKNKIWLGYNYYASKFTFKVPDYYEERSTRFWIDASGQKWRSLGSILWFTNLDVKKRHEELDISSNNYTAEKYPTYDNYDAIEVSKTADIPCDYDGVMGVPITFMDKYNPDQFEILGNSSQLAGPIEGKSKPGRFYVKGKRMYDRLAIRRKR